MEFTWWNIQKPAPDLDFQDQFHEILWKMMNVLSRQVFCVCPCKCYIPTRHRRM